MRGRQTSAIWNTAFTGLKAVRRGRHLQMYLALILDFMATSGYEPLASLRTLGVLDFVARGVLSASDVVARAAVRRYVDLDELWLVVRNVQHLLTIIVEEDAQEVVSLLLQSLLLVLLLLRWQLCDSHG